MQVTRSVALVFAVALLASCGLTPPTPAESEYFTSLGGGFNFDRDTKTASYGITIVSKGEVASGNVIEARFENPDGGEDLIRTRLVAEGESEFVFTSPPVEGLKPYTNYSIEFVLYETSAKDKILGTHNQQLQNIINQADLGW